MRVCLLALALLASSAHAFSYGPAIGLRPSKAVAISRVGTMQLKMQESESEKGETGPAAPVPVARKPDPRQTSFFARNLSEEKKTGKTYYNTENPGEVLAGPDRADEWGEELTEMGKWQRTNGPIYIQGVGGALVVLGFVNYFALGNIGNASSTIWVTAILTALLGFALQRKTD